MAPFDDTEKVTRENIQESPVTKIRNSQGLCSFYRKKEKGRKKKRWREIRKNDEKERKKGEIVVQNEESQ